MQRVLHHVDIGHREGRFAVGEVELPYADEPFIKPELQDLARKVKEAALLEPTPTAAQKAASPVPVEAPATSSAAPR